MYKLPPDERIFPRAYKKVREDVQAFGTKVITTTLRALGKRRRTPGPVPLEELESTGSAPYGYRSLDRSRQEIRLLILEPGSGTDIIRCTLKQAFLLATPPPIYETISYVCGDPSDKTIIQLNGNEVQAMATSEAALRRMRLRGKPRTLWIDSICIDPNNTEEKGHQVGMMCQIYTKTFRNLVWLGPCSPAMAESINAMESILQEIAVETRDYADFKELLFDEKGKFSFSRKPLSGNVDYLAFLLILDIPWFSRLWIVQEVSLAPTSICYCGDLEVSFTDILRSAMWLHKWYQMPEPSPLTYDRLYYAMSIFDTADKTYGRLRIRGLRSVMLNLMVRFGDMRTFDRRDRVFAILGIWQMFTETKMLPSVLEPDYNLSVVEVFKIYVRYAFEESADLWTLEWISEPSREMQDASWPSWLPAIDRRSLFERDGPLEMHGDLFYVDDTVPMILGKDSGRPNDLVVSGVLLDIISEVSPTFTPSTTSSEMLTLMADLECPRCESRVEIAVGDLETRVSLVLLGGAFQGAHVTHQEVLQGYRSYKAYLEEHGSFPDMPRDVPSSASDDEKSISEYWDNLRATARYRAVFHTGTGLIGLGPRCARPGDVVAILYGARLPMVMRPLPGLPEGRYSLLGTSYVCGIMDGEAVRGHKGMGLEDDVFRIV